MATIKVRHVVVIAMAALLVGAGCTWFAARRIAEQELRSVILGHELEVTSLCANGLKLQDTQRGDTLAMLFERRLDSAVDHAADLVDEGARLNPGSPNLVDSIRRAADYYAAKSYTERKQAAETLLATLQKQQ